MKYFLKLNRNLIFILYLSLILSACKARQNQVIVQPNNLEANPKEKLAVGTTDSTVQEPENIPYVDPPSLPLLDVDVDFSFEDCSCSGDFQKVKVILNINNGQPPYNINGQSPVKDRQVTFSVPLSSSFPLTIISSDNMIYEAKIDVPSPGSCQPPQNSCNRGGCKEKQVQVCNDEVTTIDVCVKRTGNGNKCLEWEKQEQINTVCRLKVRCE